MIFKVEFIHSTLIKSLLVIITYFKWSSKNRNVISFYLEGKEVLNRKYFDNNIYGFIDIKNLIDRFVDKI